MKRIPSCPICDASDWLSRAHEVTYTHREHEFTLPDIEYSVCGSCGFDLVLPSQQRKNDARVRDAQRVIDGLLSGAEIRSVRKSLGLSQSRASQIFGGGPNAFSKYERGEVVQSRAVDQMLGFVAKNPEVLMELASKGMLIKSTRSVARYHSQFSQFREFESVFTRVRLGSRKHFELVNDDEYMDDAA